MDSQELHQLVIISTTNSKQSSHYTCTHNYANHYCTDNQMLDSNISLGTVIATNQKPFITMGRNWWEGKPGHYYSKEHFSRK